MLRLDLLDPAPVALAAATAPLTGFLDQATDSRFARRGVGAHSRDHPRPEADDWGRQTTAWTNATGAQRRRAYAAADPPGCSSNANSNISTEVRAPRPLAGVISFNAA